MDKDTLLKRKLIDTATRAYNQNIYTFSNFLDVSELEIYYRLADELSFIHSETFGGADTCERQVIRFGSVEELGYDSAYPIHLVKISPLIEKFSDAFSHRDFLGAILNLSIERNLIGDILIREHTGYVFCITHISDFIIENLKTIKHTHVKCELADTKPGNISPVLSDIEVICASARIDAVVASLTNCSRSLALELFRTHKVFVNGTSTENNSYIMKANDILVIRGYGKFIFQSSGRETKKGRIYIQLKKYV
jgi:RNA-binding protein YlmH